VSCSTGPGEGVSLIARPLSVHARHLSPSAAEPCDARGPGEQPRVRRAPRTIATPDRVPLETYCVGRPKSDGTTVRPAHDRRRAFARFRAREAGFAQRDQRGAHRGSPGNAVDYVRSYRHDPTVWPAPPRPPGPSASLPAPPPPERASLLRSKGDRHGAGLDRAEFSRPCTNPVSVCRA
jgi:hypothetical protein